MTARHRLFRKAAGGTMRLKEGAMSIELTDQQQRAVDAEEAPRLVDPRTGTAYVLLRAELFERLRGVLGDDLQPRDAYPAIDRAFAEGWNDPKMDDYDRYDELKG
jgi:hypothetical protein